MMETLTSGRAPLGVGALKGVAWLGAGLATVAAAAVAAVLALFFAATVLVIAVMASALVTFTGLALRARRSAGPKDPDLLEARHVGGHSWVAYGWDQQGR
jgi:heme/copper-type cytochrome/quinol oxidase subunit 2